MQLCVYCSQRPAVNREHVIGRGFYKEPLPSDLITVPTCRECNAEKGDGDRRNMSDDEEYLRTVLTISEHCGDHPDANDLMNGKVMRSFTRKPAFLHSIMDTARMVNPRTAQGIILPQRLSYTVDLDRVRRVMRKVVRGLYYHGTGEPLPPDADITTEPQMEEARFQEVWKLVGNKPWLSIGGTVFMYRWGRVPDVPAASAFLMVWYDRHACGAFTLPKGFEADRLARKGSPVDRK
jgi:hypothetical protein